MSVRRKTSSRVKSSVKHKSPVKLPNEYFRLIGIISAQWEYVEIALERTVAEIGGHEYSHVGLFTANMGYQTKADIIMGYGRALEGPRPDEWKALKNVLKDLQSAYVLRNTYVHAKWLPYKRGSKSALRSVVRTRGGNFVIKDIPTTAEEMTKAAQAIDRAGNEFAQLMNRFGILMPEKKKQPAKRA